MTIEVTSTDTPAANFNNKKHIVLTIGADDWPLRIASVEAAYGGFRAEDLYPDAIPALEALRAAHRVAIEVARKRGWLDLWL